MQEPSVQMHNWEIISHYLFNFTLIIFHDPRILPHKHARNTTLPETHPIDYVKEYSMSPISHTHNL